MPRWYGRGRRSIRLPGYDYSKPGAYFVTMCIKDGLPLLGEVVDGVMRLNDYGRIVRATWDDLPNHHVNVELDAFVIMPNHIHGIIVINDVGAGPVVAGSVGVDSVGVDSVGVGSEPTPTTRSRKMHGLPEIVRGFKTFSARRINQSRRTPGQPVWQRNYYEHIIRDPQSLDRIRKYIRNNPRKSRQGSFANNPNRRITPPGAY